MLKVAIVDDEKYFRDYLRHAIKWAEYDYEVVFEAANGTQGLELSRTHQPDVLLVDINMPGLNGLALTKALREELPEARVIIITGHSEFEYAQKAIRYGVLDYLLKPFDEEELIALLIKARIDLGNRRSSEQLAGMGEQHRKNAFFNMLINPGNRLVQQTVEAQLAYYGVKPALACCMCAAVEMDQESIGEMSAQDRSLYQYALGNIANDTIFVDGKVVVFDGPQGHVIILMFFEDQRAATSLDRERFTSFCAIIKRYFEFSVTVGLSGCHSGAGGVAQAYMQAAQALENKMVLGSGRVVDYDAVLKRSDNQGFYPAYINENLMRALKEGDVAAVRDNLDAAFDSITQYELTAEYAQAICISVTSLCAAFIHERGATIDQITGGRVEQLPQLWALEKVQQMRQQAYGLFVDTIVFFKEHKATKSQMHCQIACEYIRKHFADPDLSAEKVAANLYINDRYLRKIFQNEMSTSISDYITKERVNKARELLGTGIKHADISTMVGYNDAGYFSKVFKKHMGMSPSQYENNIAAKR